MARTKKKARSRKKKKKPTGFFSIKRVVLFFFLTTLVVVSVFAAGYVIFFRTVFAGEIPTNPHSGIVFEEPDPPVHKEPITDMPDVGASEKTLPKVAIIIDDLGYHERIGNKFLNFPIELTYSFLPFAPHTGKQEKIAFNSGKTVMLHLPLEPKDPHWDPGPGALLLTDSPYLLKNKLLQALSAVPHASGINTHMGSVYTENVEKMKLLLQNLGDNNLFFIDSFTTSESVGLQVAEDQGLKSSRRHVFLDNVLDEDAICKQLEKLIKLSERKSFAIGIGHPHIETYRALEGCVGQYTGMADFVAVTEVF